MAPRIVRGRTRRAHIAVGDPNAPDVLALFAERDAHFARLYPGRDTTRIPGQTLDRPDVAFFVARSAAGLLGCGALLCQGRNGELKRFFVRREARGLGLGAGLLRAAELEGVCRGLWRIRLEVGRPQREALALYRNAGYLPIRSFGDYAPDPVSLFLGKALQRVSGPVRSGGSRRLMTQ